MIALDRIPDVKSVLTTGAAEWPCLLRDFFTACKAEGFTDAQAMTLTVEVMRSVLAVPGPGEFADGGAKKG